MRNCCNSWGNRSLSLKGKVVVVNVLILSLLQYLCSTLYTPRKVYGEVKDIVVRFLWGGGRSKIAYNTLIQPTEHGGLKLADLECRTQISLLKWVARLLNEPRSCPATFLRSLVNTTSVESLFSYKMKSPPKGMECSPFYENMFRVWSKYHLFPPEGEKAIRRESIWDNIYVSIPQQDVALRRRWEGAGIQTIHNVCHTREGRLLSHLEITERYNVPCTFLDALRLRLGIPLNWRQALTPNYEEDTAQVYEVQLSPGIRLSIKSTSAKRLYSEVISLKKGAIRTQRTWEDVMPVDGPNEWKEIYLRPFSTTRETKLQSFQYRLNHRVITCNKLLFRYKIRESELCSLCDQQDTLEHFFFQCPETRRFWAMVFQWVRAAANLDLSNLSIKEILVGVPANHPHSGRLNLILLTARFFIHRQRLFHGGSLGLIQWIAELRNRLLVERQVCMAEGKSHKFNCWRSILDYTG